jgi:single-stranded-DNA-specific exonuclease
MRKSHTPKRWQVLPGDDEAESVLQDQLGVHPIVARLLVQRGITTPAAADAFLNPSFDQLHDPFLLPDVEAACARLKTALHGREKIMIHGDYDGDGVTSAALWGRVLEKLGADVEVFVPHRQRDGYDMRKGFVERAKEKGVQLIVTTDCGIQRVDEVEHARQVGIDVIITDHHTPKADGSLPHAVAVINPNRADSKYPFSDLAGVGVAFRVCEALIRTLGLNVSSYRNGYLDLATIGTVTDVVPLIDENRVFVSYGLDALKNSKKPGIQALLEISGCNNGRALNAGTISFQLGPRLNAASRVEETQFALDLLMTKDEHEAQRLARKLHDLNDQRKEIQARVADEAMAQVAQMDIAEMRCLVVSGFNWPGSIVGIVASKVVERFHRPCVIIAKNEETGTARGSARSISPFNVVRAIDACKDLLSEYGGHAHAAGLSMDNENIADFAAQMNRLAKLELTEEDCMPSLEIAQEVAPSDLTVSVVDQIAWLAPFGNSNPAPRFISRSQPIRQITRMSEGKHLKLRFDAEGLSRWGNVDAIWWNRGDLAEGLQEGMSLDLCYRPDINDYKGQRSVQFMLEDIQPPEW